MLELHGFSITRQATSNTYCLMIVLWKTYFSIPQQFSGSCSIATENLEVRDLQVRVESECDDTGQLDFDLWKQPQSKQ